MYSAITKHSYLTHTGSFSVSGLLKIRHTLHNEITCSIHILLCAFILCGFFVVVVVVGAYDLIPEK